MEGKDYVVKDGDVILFHTLMYKNSLKIYRDVYGFLNERIWKTICVFVNFRKKK